MSGPFWGGVLLALVVVQILVIWSIRRHRDPTLKIECDSPIDELMPSLSGLTSYEAPERAELTIDTDSSAVDAAVASVLAIVRDRCRTG